MRGLSFLWFGGLLLSLLTCQSVSESSPPPSRPNILFLMGDDHTNAAISAYGGILAEYAQTTNIDRLAAEGMRFDQCFNVNAICSPSRATILTGKYSHKNGVFCLNQRFDSTQTTSATLLQEAGYQTAVFGKWHLKSTPVGFDEYKVLKKQGRYQDPQFVEKGQDSLVTRAGWSTDVIADLAIAFLKERQVDKPFFVMTHFKATHDPWASRPPYDTLFQNMDLPEPPNLYDEYENRSEAALRTTLKLEMINQGTFPHDRIAGADWRTQRGHIYQQYIKDFLRCGRVLDENIGRILDFLEAEGLADNTIVIYTADQGHFLGEHGFFSKRFMYEEAMRMPLIVRHPGQIAAGSVNDDLVTNVDFAPTIADLAGLNVPTEMQGDSLAPLLKGSTPTNWRTSI
ncbi:MAG: sulfatase-like hydrolase/transferase, partial [Bacteroidota bacterium]